MGISIANQEKFDLKVYIYYKDQLPKEFNYLNKVFSCDMGEIFTHITQDENTLFVGAGKEEVLTLEEIRNMMAKISRKTRDLKFETAKLHLPKSGAFCSEQIVRVITQGTLLGLYRFEKYKKQKEPVVSPHFYIDMAGDQNQADQQIKEALNEVHGISLARDLINEPANKLYPESFAKIAQDVGAESGFQVEVLDEIQMEALGMGALLAVGNGSVNPPRLIVMRHMQGDDQEVLGLVGKGLTCDTGGYSLKGTDSMYYMKSDMSGAANVLGLMSILAKNNIKKNVVAVIPSCENVISGKSYKIGDVLKTMKGKTVEVLNTDAEGRLVLADALHYIVEEEKVDKIIDLATLTGVAGTTFGNIYSATVTNNDEFYNQFTEAAKLADEKFWRLPTDKAYKEMIKSDVADIKNTGGSGGGTITAAMFLQEFIQEKPWIHLDIAATACTNPGRSDYEYKGGTGVGIRTIYELIKQ